MALALVAPHARALFLVTGRVAPASLPPFGNEANLTVPSSRVRRLSAEQSVCPRLVVHAFFHCFLYGSASVRAHPVQEDVQSGVAEWKISGNLAQRARSSIH